MDQDPIIGTFMATATAMTDSCSRAGESATDHYRPAAGRLGYLAIFDVNTNRLRPRQLMPIGRPKLARASRTAPSSRRASPTHSLPVVLVLQPTSS